MVGWVGERHSLSVPLVAVPLVAVLLWLSLWRQSSCGDGAHTPAPAFPFCCGISERAPAETAALRPAHLPYRVACLQCKVFTNNLFDPDCFTAAVDNALGALPALVAAGVDGVFLDGVVEFDIGCSPQTPCNGNCNPTADINCTHAGSWYKMYLFTK